MTWVASCASVDFLVAVTAAVIPTPEADYFGCLNNSRKVDRPPIVATAVRDGDKNVDIGANLFNSKSNDMTYNGDDAEDFPTPPRGGAGGLPSTPRASQGPQMPDTVDDACTGGVKQKRKPRVTAGNIKDFVETSKQLTIVLQTWRRQDHFDNQEAEKRGTYMRHTRSSGFLDEESVGSLALSYLEKNPREGATASKGVTSKKRVSFDTVEGSAVDHYTPTSTAEFVPNVPNVVDVQVVHDDVHTDVHLGKLEKGTLPTSTTVESRTDAIVDAMVVDACTDDIIDATVVDACTNDIVDATENDASTDSVVADGNVNDGGIEISTIEGNVNDGGTKIIVHNIIDAILDAVVAMGTDATVESGTDAIVDAMNRCCCRVVCPSDAADDIVDAKEAKGTDATVEDVKEENTHNTTEACTEQNNEAGKATKLHMIQLSLVQIPIVGNTKGKSLEVPCGRAAATDTDEAGTKNADKEAKNGHEDERQERVKYLVVMPVRIVALPLLTCEKKKRRDNLCIILDMNGLLMRRYKVSFYKGIARSSTLDWARSKYQVVTRPNVTGKIQFEYVVRPNASKVLDALLQRAQVALWSSMTQDNLVVTLNPCFPRLNKQRFYWSSGV
ncbi:hypothetical protein L7F22_018875 [Adiantum nelumboides]|nr:hypothetical protein [Adiantum nelumboides]